jgi:hypothetical protein
LLDGLQLLLLKSLFEYLLLLLPPLISLALLPLPVDLPISYAYHLLIPLCRIKLSLIPSLTPILLILSLSQPTPKSLVLFTYLPVLKSPTHLILSLCLSLYLV